MRARASAQAMPASDRCVSCGQAKAEANNLFQSKYSQRKGRDFSPGGKRYCSSQGILKHVRYL
jgi:DNA-directed RNA polymerase subunit N (RpoN/RPB10)